MRCAMGAAIGTGTGIAIGAVFGEPLPLLLDFDFDFDMPVPGLIDFEDLPATIPERAICSLTVTPRMRTIHRIIQYPVLLVEGASLQ